jgi:undecaprenyl diphosphate synthase
MSQSLPRHIAIIMDGNGRWAETRGLSRAEGHKAGAEAARRALQALRDMNIPYVTLFSFSSENWNRPAGEVSGLMDLLRYYLKKETADLHKHKARLRVIGELDKLPGDIRELVEQAEKITQDNDGMTVAIALSYGGRQDIVQAAQRIAEKGYAPDKIDAELFSNHMMTAGMPEPDLMIRTGGEYRVSNFLLWQMAYTELFFTKTRWPDFDKKDVEEAISFFQGRERRYGGLPGKATADQGNL